MTGPRSVGSASVTIVPDTSGWVAKISAQILPSAKTLGEQFGKVMGDEIARQLGERTKNAPIGPDEPKSRDQGSKSAGAFADAFKAKLRAAMAALPPIEIGVAASEAEQKLRDIRVDLADLSGKQIGVDLTDVEAIAKLDELRARLAELNASAESVSIRADTSVALAQLDKLRASIDEMTAVKHDVDVDVNVDDRQLDEVPAKLAAVDAAAGNSSGGINLFGSRIANIGALAIGAADVAIPALLAIGAAAGGLIAAVGVGALGFSGIGAALQAHDRPTGGGSSGSGASTAIQAQQRQLAAAQATQSAQDQLTSAVQNQTKAEKNLHDARVQALQDLQDLDNKLKDNTLSQQQAAIDLVQAKQTLAVTLTAPGATLAQYAQQVAQAQLNVATAQQKVNELALTGSRLTPQDALAHKQGVNGNPAVVSAQQALTDANHKLAEAQQNVTDTAVKNKLADDAAAASLANAAGGANSYAAALAKLNPLQKQFVEFLISLKPLLDEVKLAASAFLPGLEAGIKDAEPAFGGILTVVSAVAKALGSALQQIFAQFNTPAGRQFAAFLTTELPKQIGFLTTLFIDFGRIFASVWEAAGPLIDAADKAILSFFDNTSKNAASSGLTGFFDSLIPVMPLIAQALSALGRVFTSVFRALEPAMGPILNLITLIADGIATLVSGPVGQLLVQTFVDLVTAASPLIPLFVQIVQTILPPLISLLDTVITQGVAPLVVAIANDLQPILPPLATAITALVKALAPFIIQLINSLIPVLPQLATLFVAVLKAVIPIIPEFGQFLQALTPLVKPLTDLATQMVKLTAQLLPLIVPLIKPITAVLIPLAAALVPVANAFDSLANAIGKIVGPIERLIGDIPGLKQLAGLGGGSGGGTLGTIEKFVSNPISGLAHLAHIPGFAAGGAVQAGVPITAAEYGPELFVPKGTYIPQVDGTIVNATDTARWQKQMGNGSSRTNVFNNYALDPNSYSHAVVTRMAARAV